MLLTMHTCPDCEQEYMGAGVPVCDDWAQLTKRTICPECAENRGMSQCAGCDEWVDNSELSEGTDYEYFCNDCWNDRFSTCDGCGGVFDRDYVYYDERSGYSYCGDCTPSHDEFEPKHFNGKHNYTRMPSQRCFGVELETSECDCYHDLDGSWWGAKPDCSVYGMEFYSGILYGDDGLAACDDICKFAARHGWNVDDRCGYHAHFDMRGESEDSLKAIACAYLLTYDVWKEFVESNRVEGRYCHGSSASISELYSSTSFSNFAYNQTRYTWINFAAYNHHKTFEVRLHEGTLDGSDVTNWIRAHATFMDWASEAGWAKVRNTLLCMDNAEKFEFIAQVWAKAGCADIGECYRKYAQNNNAEWAACEAWA